LTTQSNSRQSRSTRTGSGSRTRPKLRRSLRRFLKTMTDKPHMSPDSVRLPLLSLHSLPGTCYAVSQAMSLSPVIYLTWVEPAVSLKSNWFIFLCRWSNMRK
jgi:hypothetical protein